MKRSFWVVLLILCLVFVGSGCSYHTHKSYTFTVDTGDMVKIELETTKGYDISSELPFAISKDGSTLSEGFFIPAERFEDYVAVVNEDVDAILLESSTKDEIQYIFWSYDDSEYNYAIRINDSNTGLIIANPISEESARECFNRLTISLEND